MASAPLSLQDCCAPSYSGFTCILNLDQKFMEYVASEEYAYKKREGFRAL